ncbi:MAG: DUF5011 domain-containing protein, partial [Bacteroidia bacterium]|nr:DUF5011 domain-containing protein [Bacteroidia bacterium]
VSLRGQNPLLVDVYDRNYTDPGVDASDNYYSSNSLIQTKQSNVDVNALGDYMITYIVKDGSGNETRLSRGVKVVDRIAPTIEILGDNPLDMKRFSDYIEPGIRISDNYESQDSLALKVVIETDLGNRNDTLWADLGGWRYIRYQVTDASGNLSIKVERSIRVLATAIGLNELEQSGMLSVYPNPNNGTFKLSFKQPINGEVQLTVYNMLGAKVYDEQVNASDLSSKQINVESVMPGIYVVYVKRGNEIYSQRITIK